MMKFRFSKLLAVLSALVATPITWAALASAPADQAVVPAEGVTSGEPPAEVIVRRIVVVRGEGGASGGRSVDVPSQASAPLASPAQKPAAAPAARTRAS